MTADQPEMSARCRDLFARVQNGNETVFLPEAALSDVIWTLRSFYGWPAERICSFVGNLLAIDAVRMSRKPLVWQALSFFDQTGIDFSDALIAAEMQEVGLTELYSYDRDFDKVEGVNRFEP
jgi:predicted nucleic-acid-binding protein